MKLSDFATELKSDNRFIKASFGGFAGSGKSRTGSEFVIGAYKRMSLKKPILFIDNEKGSRFLIPKFKEAGIQTLVKQTVQLADILTAFELVNNGEVDFLFVDSLTKVWYNFVNQYKEKNRRVFLTLQDWGKILPDWQEKFADKFVNLNGNCVFTGRGGYSYDMEEGEDGKKQFVKSGVKMKMAGETPYEPDLNVWMSIEQDMGDNGKPIVWREAIILKDRSDLIDGKTFKNPTFKDFQPVLDYIMSAPVGDVAKESSNENLAPAEVWSDKRDRRLIVLEKIGNEFDRAGLGTSKEDKQFKILVSEKFFGTSSKTELEKVSLDLLEARYEDIHRFMVSLPDVDVADRVAYLNGFKIENELPFK